MIDNDMNCYMANKQFLAHPLAWFLYKKHKAQNALETLKQLCTNKDVLVRNYSNKFRACHFARALYGANERATQFVGNGTGNAFASSKYNVGKCIIRTKGIFFEAYWLKTSSLGMI